MPHMDMSSRSENSVNKRMMCFFWFAGAYGWKMVLYLIQPCPDEAGRDISVCAPGRDSVQNNVNMML